MEKGRIDGARVAHLPGSLWPTSGGSLGATIDRDKRAGSSRMPRGPRERVHRAGVVGLTEGSLRPLRGRPGGFVAAWEGRIDGRFFSLPEAAHRHPGSGPGGALGALRGLRQANGAATGLRDPP